MTQPSQLLFLPGASGNTDFWQAVAQPLLWGDADPISPVAVGQRLAALLPQAQLHVFAGGDHDLGHALAHEVAPLIDAHLASAAPMHDNAHPAKNRYEKTPP